MNADDVPGRTEQDAKKPEDSKMIQIDTLGTERPVRVNQTNKSGRYL
jgi:hypothetical protein